MIGMERNGLEEIEQRRTFVPRRTLRLVHHIIAIERTQRETSDILKAERTDKVHIFRHNFIEHRLIEAAKVHLIDGQHHMLDTEQRNKESVAVRLCDNAVAGINEDDSKVGRRSARDHVARVLLVSRRISNDKFALIGREIAISHIDGDTLFALSLQAIEQKGIVDVFASISHALGIALQRGELIFVQFLRVEEQATNQR